MANKNLYFRDRFGDWRLLNENIPISEVNAKILEFLKEHNFKSYYTRTWYDKDGNAWYDVGSHTEFFVWGFEEE